jgi:hypothetical protein
MTLQGTLKITLAIAYLAAIGVITRTNVLTP